MRRADRLFRIVQLLRTHEVRTAATLAAELEVSERTIYRDIQDLIGSGVPIEGEAGVGYVLSRDVDLPPLMFSEGEIEALVAGARIVEAWGDDDLARHARSVVSKAECVLPDELRSRVKDVQIFAPDFHVPDEITRNVEPVRRAVASRRKLRLDYEDGRGTLSMRVVRPLGLNFWGASWTVAAWCELREDFRSFRLDRMRRVEVLDEPIPDEPDRDLAAFLRRVSGGRD